MRWIKAEGEASRSSSHAPRSCSLSDIAIRLSHVAVQCYVFLFDYHRSQGQEETFHILALAGSLGRRDAGQYAPMLQVIFGQSLSTYSCKKGTSESDQIPSRRLIRAIWSAAWGNSQQTQLAPVQIGQFGIGDCQREKPDCASRSGRWVGQDLVGESTYNGRVKGCPSSLLVILAAERELTDRPSDLVLLK